MGPHLVTETDANKGRHTKIIKNSECPSVWQSHGVCPVINTEQQRRVSLQCLCNSRKEHDSTAYLTRIHTHTQTHGHPRGQVHTHTLTPEAIINKHIQHIFLWIKYHHWWQCAFSNKQQSSELLPFSVHSQYLQYFHWFRRCSHSQQCLKLIFKCSFCSGKPMVSNSIIKPAMFKILSVHLHQFPCRFLTF